jgi:hypothetical protein
MNEQANMQRFVGICDVSHSPHGSSATLRLSDGGMA